MAPGDLCFVDVLYVRKQCYVKLVWLNDPLGLFPRNR